MIKVLILTDGKAGHENQSRAFVRALGCEADVCSIRFKSKFHKAMSYVLDRLGIRTLSLFVSPVSNCQLLTTNYRAVVGTGSGTFYAALAMAKRLRVKCGVVLYPRGYRIRHFDCVLAPSFDRPMNAANVIVIPVNLVANDAAFYEKGAAAFGERHQQKKDALAVIVGGPNKCSTMTAEWMKEQLDKIFADNAGKEFWVTTSRRTPADVESVVNSYPWDYKLLYSNDHFNPIPAFVKLAKRLYVTAESTGMLSEACTFGEAEVVALDNLNSGSHKFRRFVEDLIRAGYVDGNRKVDLSVQFEKARKLVLGLESPQYFRLKVGFAQ